LNHLPGKLLESLRSTLRKSPLDNDVLAFHVTEFAKHLNNASYIFSYPWEINPISHFLPDCPARAASGHAAAPPRSVMNSRRL
jgi:hypothetical protein